MALVLFDEFWSSLTAGRHRPTSPDTVSEGAMALLPNVFTHMRSIYLLIIDEYDPFAVH